MVHPVLSASYRLVFVAGPLDRAPVAAIMPEQLTGKPQDLMRKERLVDQAYAHIKKQLLDGLIRDSAWFAIDEIAAALSISRQPVME